MRHGEDGEGKERAAWSGFLIVVQTGDGTMMRKLPHFVKADTSTEPLKKGGEASVNPISKDFLGMANDLTTTVSTLTNDWFSPVYGASYISRSYELPVGTSRE